MSLNQLNYSMKVSIIVPVYNTVEYLRDCLNSIILQTFKDFEVILIDDGSTDGSSEICDEYAKVDHRFIVIHKLNEGVTKARNVALGIAKGEFVSFIDSDDTILSNMLEDMIKIADKQSVDIVKSCDFLNAQFTHSSNSFYSGTEALEHLLKFDDRIHASLCLGIFKRELFNDICFPVDIQFWEDFTISALLLSKARKIAILSNKYYYYRERQDSATHVIINFKTLSCLKIADYLSSCNIYNSSIEYCNVKSYFIRFCYFCLRTDGCDLNIKNIVIAEIRNNINVILKATVIPLKTKALILLAFLLPSVALKMTKYILKK